MNGWKSHETNKTSSTTVKWTQETCDFVGGKGKEELSLICSFSFHRLVRILYDIKWHVACLKKCIHIIMSIIYCRCSSSPSSWPTYIVPFLLNWNNVRYVFLQIKYAHQCILIPDLTSNNGSRFFFIATHALIM